MTDFLEWAIIKVSITAVFKKLIILLSQEVRRTELTMETNN